MIHISYFRLSGPVFFMVWHDNCTSTFIFYLDFILLIYLFFFKLGSRLYLSWMQIANWKNSCLFIVRIFWLFLRTSYTEACWRNTTFSWYMSIWYYFKKWYFFFSIINLALFELYLLLLRFQYQILYAVFIVIMYCFFVSYAKIETNLHFQIF